MLKEGLLLAAPGAILGMGLAWLAVSLLNAAKPEILVRYPPVVMDMRVLAFTLVLTIATAALFGIAPALSAARR